MTSYNYGNSKSPYQTKGLVFGRQASVDTNRTAHISDESLESMCRMIDACGDLNRHNWSIDLGTGTGFTALTLSGISNHVIASGLSAPMLHQVKRLGQERNIDNLHLSQNAAEALPFTDQSIDLVSSRDSAHHFRDFEKVLNEAHRILKFGGSLLMADSVAPEQDDIASWMNNIERRRNCSHVESRKISTIAKILTDNGFRVANGAYQRIYLRFNEWTADTNLEREEVETLQRDFLRAPDATRETFQVAPIHGNITFSWPYWVFRAVKL